MHKDTALNIIKRKIALEHKTITAAAKALGIDRSNLSLALNNHLDPIPEYLLEFAGLTLTTKHIYGSKK